MMSLILPAYVLMTHVGELTEKRLIRLTLKPKSEQQNQREDIYDFLHQEKEMREQQQEYHARIRSENKNNADTNNNSNNNNNNQNNNNHNNNNNHHYDNSNRETHEDIELQAVDHFHHPRIK